MLLSPTVIVTVTEVGAVGALMKKGNIQISFMQTPTDLLKCIEILPVGYVANCAGMALRTQCVVPDPLHVRTQMS